jgi:glutathione S-transferase
VDEAMQWFYSNYYKDHGYGLVYPQVFAQHKRPTGDYPNVRRWIGNMKALRHWADVRQVADSFTASLKDKQFVSI